MNPNPHRTDEAACLGDIPIPSFGLIYDRPNECDNTNVTNQKNHDSKCNSKKRKRNEMTRTVTLEDTPEKEKSSSLHHLFTKPIRNNNNKRRKLRLRQQIDSVVDKISKASSPSKTRSVSSTKDTEKFDIPISIKSALYGNIRRIFQATSILSSSLNSSSSIINENNCDPKVFYLLDYIDFYCSNSTVDYRGQISNLLVGSGNEMLQQIIVAPYYIDSTKRRLHSTPTNNTSTSSKKSYMDIIHHTKAGLTTAEIEKKTTTTSKSNINISSQLPIGCVSVSFDDLLSLTIASLIQRKVRLKKTNSFYQKKKQQEKINNGSKRPLKSPKDKSFYTYYNGSNVLSEGFQVASSYSSSSSTSCPPQSMTQYGIQYTKLNPVVSFLKKRSEGQSIKNIGALSPSKNNEDELNKFQFLHSKVLGDSLTRDLLLNCIVLIPACLCNPRHNMSYSDNSSKENYIQVAGPPLKGSCPLLSFSSQQDQEKLPEQKQKNQLDKDIDSSSDNNSLLPRKSIFYNQSYIPKVGLPPHHIMNSPTSSSSTDFQLLDSMLDLMYVPSPNTSTSMTKATTQNNTNTKKKIRMSRWKRVKINGMKMCQIILKRHRKTDYHRILDHTCPLYQYYDTNNSSSSTTTTSTPSLSIENLVQMHTKSEQVYIYLKKIIDHVFSPPLTPVAISESMKEVPCCDELSIWGSLHNYKQFLSTLKYFITILKAKDDFPVKLLMNGIRVLDFEWLQQKQGGHSSTKKVKKGTKSNNKSNHEAMTLLVKKFMTWMYCDFIFPLLKSLFYITETEYLGDQVVYYRKPVWTKLRSLFLQQYTSESSASESDTSSTTKNKNASPGCFQEIDVTQEQEYKTSLTLRLKPKKNGIRPLNIGLSKPPKAIVYQTSDNTTSTTPTTSCNQTLNTKKGNSFDKNYAPPSINKTLKSTLEVLKYEYEQNPHKFGSGVFGYDGIYIKLCKFLQNRRRGEELYFVSVDIHKCYDNIHIGFLCRLLGCTPPYDTTRGINIDPKDIILSNDEYILQRFDVLHSFRMQNRIMHKQIHKVSTTSNNNNNNNCHLSSSSTVELFPNNLFNSNNVHREEINDKFFSSIFVNGTIPSYTTKNSTIDNFLNTTIQRTEILNQLKSHLEQTVVEIPTHNSNKPRYFLQTKGIPQGSILSVYLCNFYFGYMERHFLFPSPDFPFFHHQQREKASNHGSKQKKSNAPCRSSSSALIRDTVKSNKQPENEDFSFLARVTDDFCLITTSKQTAKQFLTRMYRGVPDLGICINKGKTEISPNLKQVLDQIEGDNQNVTLTKTRDSDRIINSSKKVSLQEETMKGKWNTTTSSKNTDVQKKDKASLFNFSWDGLLFNLETCEIRIDYSRFHKSRKSEITKTTDIGKSMKLCFKHFVKPRCHALLYDDLFLGHSPHNIVVNIYQLFLYAGIKIVIYVQNLCLLSSSSLSSVSSDQKNTNSIIRNEEFVIDSIMEMIDFSYNLIRSNLKRAEEFLHKNSHEEQPDSHNFDHNTGNTLLIDIIPPSFNKDERKRKTPPTRYTYENLHYIESLGLNTFQEIGIDALCCVFNKQEEKRTTGKEMSFGSCCFDGIVQKLIMSTQNKVEEENREVNRRRWWYKITRRALEDFDLNSFVY